jgi:hypothetical protein
MTAISPLLLVEPPVRRAAVATFPAVPRRPADGAPAQPVARPRLRAIEGGRSAEVRRRRRVYRRRRVLVGFLVAVGLLAAGRVAMTATDLVAVPAAEPATVEASPVAGTPATAVYVVQPGDTLWSIARRVRPDRDPRTVVDELSSRVPGGLQPGQRLDLTDLDG